MKSVFSFIVASVFLFAICYRKRKCRTLETGSAADEFVPRIFAPKDGDIVSIHSKQENDIVSEMIPDWGWIGMTRVLEPGQKPFNKWSDNTKIDYMGPFNLDPVDNGNAPLSNWAQDINADFSHCVGIDGGDHWTQYRCNDSAETASVVCEYPL